MYRRKGGEEEEFGFQEENRGIQAMENEKWRSNELNRKNIISVTQEEKNVFFWKLAAVIGRKVCEIQVLNWWRKSLYRFLFNTGKIDINKTKKTDDKDIKRNTKELVKDYKNMKGGGLKRKEIKLKDNLWSMNNNAKENL